MTLPTQVFVRDQAKGRASLGPDGIEPLAEPLCGWHKPRGGGLWTSSLLDDGTSGWVRWCLDEQFAGPAFDTWHLVPDPAARIYEVDAYDDLAGLARRFPSVCDHDRPCPDYRMGAEVSWRRVAEAYDAVHLTDEGQWATRLTMPLSLYGWDCESTLWFRWRFAEVRHLGQRSFARQDAGV